MLTTWPGDGGPFITLPIVVTKDPQGRQNAGMYRLQVFDGQTTGMHIHIHHDGAANFREAGDRMEVAVALGTDPAVTYAATAPLPPGISEFMFAGFLRGEPVELAQCATVDLAVPADSEIVLEGYVEKGETRLEGPFGDHTGYYSLADQYPVFHLTAMSHRRDPIYPATIVGKPPMEDAYLGKATERLFLPLLQLVQPEIVDMDLPIEGVFHDCAIISIRKEYPGHARKIMSAVWGMGQMMFTKFVVVVDEHVDVHDYSEVTWRVFNNVDPERDTVIVSRPARRARPLEPDGALRRQDGHRCDQVVAGRGPPARVAGRAGHGPGRGPPRERALGGVRPAVRLTASASRHGAGARVAGAYGGWYNPRQPGRPGRGVCRAGFVRAESTGVTLLG